MTNLLLQLIFWISAGAVLYSYLLYPLLVWALSRILGRHSVPPDLPDHELPRVALLIAAHNEQQVIEQRLLNALQLDYPADRLQIIIASDGSSDATNAIVRRFQDPRVRLIEFTEQRGKSATLNRAIPQIDAQVLVLSDANTCTDLQAIRRLVRWFADPRVIAVCGRLQLLDPTTGRNVDSMYWRYETFIKKCEARLGALLGSNGAIYAIRQNQYVPIADQTIVDDFVIPLLIKLRHGGDIVYDASATATEETPPGVSDEFRRRIRIGAGGFQAIGMLKALLNPLRGWVALSFFSHKVLRWLCPFCLLAALLSAALLWQTPLYLGMLLAQVVLYLTAVAVSVLPSNNRLLRPLRLSSMFVSMNVALLFGFFRWLRGQQRGIWSPTTRAPAASETPDRSAKAVAAQD